MTQSLRRLRHVIRKEFLELRQDPRLFSLVIIAPILQLTMLGYAATTDVKNVPVVIVDQDRSGDAEHTLVVAAHQRAERIPVAAPDEREKGAVVGFRRAQREHLGPPPPQEEGSPKKVPRGGGSPEEGAPHHRLWRYDTRSAT